ncbi:MAG TPA: histidine kinase N-terminal 7TM domain-containing protein, partial [Anaerolineae bacterium]|nr:histidine kinase N-terminal 7TM domain-containing protein [Anaerolineae bacterium]
MFDLFLGLLELGNFLLAAAIVVNVFALLLWLFPQSWRNPTQRAFSALLTFVGFVYIGQVFLLRSDGLDGAYIWLRFKWIGIAFVPAAYLHFSNAVLRSTFVDSRIRRIATAVAYVIGTVFLALVLFTNYVVGAPFNYPYATQLSAGPLFPLFAIYFFATTAWGIYNIEVARRRTLTPTSRRRLRRLAFAFLAPALGVFPYLVFSGFPALIPPIILLLLTFFGTLGLILMLVIMAYTVAIEGALAPDRIIKQKFIHYMLRGPLVAVGVVVALTIVPPIERLLGLSHEAVLYATVIVGIILFEMLISRGKPYLDQLLFWQDRNEIKTIQELDTRLLTTSNLRQLLENILSAMCDLLRVQSGFVLAAEADGWKLEALVGTREPAQKYLAGQTTPPQFGNGENIVHQFVAIGDYWLYPLKVNGSDSIVGVIAVAARAPQPDLSDHERELV